MSISTAVVDFLTKTKVLRALIDGLKDHESYKQHLARSMTPVAERIAAEYAVNVLSASISVLRNESVASDAETRTPCDGPSTAAGITLHTHTITYTVGTTTARKKKLPSESTPYGS